MSNAASRYELYGKMVERSNAQAARIASLEAALDELEQAAYEAIDHVYGCAHCYGLWMGSMVKKRILDGKRHCPYCHIFVLADVTDTDRGRDYIAFAGMV